MARYRVESGRFSTCSRCASGWPADRSPPPLPPVPQDPSRRARGARAALPRGQGRPRRASAGRSAGPRPEHDLGYGQRRRARGSALRTRGAPQRREAQRPRPRHGAAQVRRDFDRAPAARDPSPPRRDRPSAAIGRARVVAVVQRWRSRLGREAIPPLGSRRRRADQGRAVAVHFDRMRCARADDRRRAAPQRSLRGGSRLIPLLSAPAVNLTRELAALVEHVERGDGTWQDLCRARLWCEHITGEIERRPRSASETAPDQGGRTA